MNGTKQGDKRKPVSIRLVNHYDGRKEKFDSGGYAPLLVQLLTEAGYDGEWDVVMQPPCEAIVDQIKVVSFDKTKRYVRVVVQPTGNDTARGFNVETYSLEPVAVHKRLSSAVARLYKAVTVPNEPEKPTPTARAEHAGGEAMPPAKTRGEQDPSTPPTAPMIVHKAGEERSAALLVSGGYGLILTTFLKKVGVAGRWLVRLGEETGVEDPRKHIHIESLENGIIRVVIVPGTTVDPRVVEVTVPATYDATEVFAAFQAVAKGKEFTIPPQRRAAEVKVDAAPTEPPREDPKPAGPPTAPATAQAKAEGGHMDEGILERVRQDLITATRTSPGHTIEKAAITAIITKHVSPPAAPHYKTLVGRGVISATDRNGIFTVSDKPLEPVPERRRHRARIQAPDAQRAAPKPDGKAARTPVVASTKGNGHARPEQVESTPKPAPPTNGGANILDRIQELMLAGKHKAELEDRLRRLQEKMKPLQYRLAPLVQQQQELVAEIAALSAAQEELETIRKVLLGGSGTSPTRRALAQA